MTNLKIIELGAVNSFLPSLLYEKHFPGNSKKYKKGLL